MTKLGSTLRGSHKAALQVLARLHFFLELGVPFQAHMVGRIWFLVIVALWSLFSY